MSIHGDKKFSAKRLWIGMAHVRSRPGNEMLEGAAGAFVAALAWAFDRAEYCRHVTEKLNSYEFDVIDVDDVEPFVERKAKGNVANELEELASSVSEIDPVALDVFQTYEKE